MWRYCWGEPQIVLPNLVVLASLGSGSLRLHLPVFPLRRADVGVVGLLPGWRSLTAVEAKWCRMDVDVWGAVVVVVPLGAFALAYACPLLLVVDFVAAAGAAFPRLAFLLQGLGTVGAVAGTVSAGPVVLFSPRILLVS